MDSYVKQDENSTTMYGDLAPWWPLLSRPEDYAEEASIYLRVLTEALGRSPRTLLELGSGGGNNALHMKAQRDLTLVDLSPEMLHVSQALNPECTHVAGDMRTVRLERTFDAVFVHDAIMYMRSEEDLKRAIETAFAHLEPGGVALFAPDHTRENFREGTDHGGHDEASGRGLRYLEWTHDPDPEDETFFVDYAFLLRAANGTVTCVNERHEEGLFGRNTWLRVLTDAGFDATSRPFEHSELDPGECELFVGRKSR